LQPFPHAIVCALAGKVVATKPKTPNRRKASRDLCYDDSPLPNIDSVDGALCAVASEAFRQSSTMYFGERDEGFIVVPAIGREPFSRDAQPLRDERQVG
jgi:hypothetical protein